MKTINEQIAEQQARLKALSPSRKSHLRRQATRVANTHMADSSTFWRGLSARQVLAALSD